MADLYKNLRAIAMSEVFRETPEYRLRHVQRWFSKTFHVPLPEVEQMHELDVLQVFYEERYQQMVEAAEEKPDAMLALEEEIRILIETDEEEKKRLMREAEAKTEDAAFQDQVDAMAAAQQKAAFERASKSVERQMANVVPRRAIREPEIDDGVKQQPKKPIPDISMKFADDNAEFELLLNEDGAGNLSIAATPKRK